jgi:membrane-anchored protein YejM (alkaline phosphatase superfamily)
MKSWGVLALVSLIIALILIGQVVIFRLQWYQTLLSGFLGVAFLIVWFISSVFAAYPENEEYGINISLES